MACSRGAFPFSGPPATLWEPSGKTRLPAPHAFTAALRPKAERRSGTSSGATALLPQGKQAFGQGHGPPQKAVTVRAGQGQGEPSGGPANAYTLAGRCGSRTGLQGRAAKVRDTNKYYMFSQGISRRQSQK